MRAPIAAAFVALVAIGSVAPREASAVQDPVSPHGLLPESLDCLACHTGTAWKPIRDRLDFDHDRETGFELAGRHAEVACGSCHLTLRFEDPGAECSGCHVDVHSGALGSDCASCHDTDSFITAPGPEQHELTSFPLTGAHLEIGCESCHVDERGGLYSGADTQCVSCHIEEYESAELVDHVGAGFSTECLECHTTDAWRAAPAFDHLALSGGFPLLGAHELITCEACHIRSTGETKFSPSAETDCYACHRVDYEREHAGSGIPTQCLLCHTRSDWEGGDESFDHSLTGFPLVGVHVDLDCEGCHLPAGGLRFDVPASQDECVACHRTDYDAAHAGTNFPTTCVDCHTPSSWDAADFDHALTGFDLVGSHTALGCESCHSPTDNRLLFTPPSSQDDCVACHRPDYDANHQGSGFPTTCADCHTAGGWAGATFDHGSFFPIESGPHSGAACQNCHTVPADFRTFSCLNCHEHRQSEADNEHKDVNGYLYESGACYSCHPDGRS